MLVFLVRQSENQVSDLECNTSPVSFSGVENASNCALPKRDDPGNIEDLKGEIFLEERVKELIK